MKPQIFIVDDNEMMREFLASYFQMEYDVKSFGSAEDVLRALNPEKKPDLLLADYSMEGLDGLELLQNLKASAYYSDIPVVFVSGCASRNASWHMLVVSSRYPCAMLISARI